MGELLFRGGQKGRSYLGQYGVLNALSMFFISRFIESSFLALNVILVYTEVRKQSDEAFLSLIHVELNESPHHHS